MPEVQLLSNGRYHVMVTNAGGGYSRWNNLAITRWNEDATLDNWGICVYLSSAGSREIWSNTYQPTLCKADCYEATFIEGRTIFRCLNHAIETRHGFGAPGLQQTVYRNRNRQRVTGNSVYA